jgi:hypothetical protein
MVWDQQAAKTMQYAASSTRPCARNIKDWQLGFCHDTPPERLIAVHAAHAPKIVAAKKRKGRASTRKGTWAISSSGTSRNGSERATEVLVAVRGSPKCWWQ